MHFRGNRGTERHGRELECGQVAYERQPNLTRRMPVQQQGALHLASAGDGAVFRQRLDGGSGQSGLLEQGESERFGETWIGGSGKEGFDRVVGWARFGNG